MGACIYALWAVMCTSCTLCVRQQWWLHRVYVCVHIAFYGVYVYVPIYIYWLAVIPNSWCLRDRLLQHCGDFLEGQAASAAARNRAITGL